MHNPKRLLWSLGVLLLLAGASLTVAESAQGASSGVAPRATGISRSSLVGLAQTEPAHWVTGLQPHAGGARETVESHNWSGDVDFGPQFTGASGQWVVPAVQPSQTAQFSATWIGLDGATNTSLIQTGTTQETSGGSTDYYAWYEILPYNSVPLFFVSPGDHKELNAPIVGMVPSSDGRGYFMVGADGGVFAFGDAKFEGSCPAIGGCSGAAVTVMPDASGNGYWLVTATGLVYAFGDATTFGAPGAQGAPVTSATRTPDGEGYWILLANGTVDAYGDAANLGGPVNHTGGLNPASAIFSTADGKGYWVSAATGAVFSFGDAPNDGGMGGTHLNGSIIAGTGF